jgi:hypothetical protein
VIASRKAGKRGAVGIEVEGDADAEPEKLELVLGERTRRRSDEAFTWDDGGVVDVMAMMAAFVPPGRLILG